MTLYGFDIKPERGLDVFWKLFASLSIHNRKTVMLSQWWLSSLNQWLISGLTRNQAFFYYLFHPVLMLNFVKRVSIL